MNKGFFVVFLGIVIGAMALIFVNQANSPVPAGMVAQKSVTVAEAPAPKAEAAPQTPAKPAEKPGEKPGAGNGSATPAPVTPAPSKPEPSKPEPSTAAPAPSEPAKPAARQPEPGRSVSPSATPSESVSPKPEPAAQPATPKPEPAAPAPQRAEPVVTPEPAKPEPAKVEQAAEPAAPRGKFPVLKNISLHFKDNGMALRIEADRQFSYKTFVLPSPDRYAIDLIGTWENMRVPKVPANQLVKGMRVGKQSGGPRMVMDLQRAPKKHNVVWLSPTILEIQIE